jgi:hypothetical protein
VESFQEQMMVREKIPSITPKEKKYQDSKQFHGFGKDGRVPS